MRRFLHNLFVGLLIFLAALTFSATAIAGWTHQTALVTDRFVGTITSATEDPVVIESLGTRLADQVVSRLGLEQRLQDLLPPALDRLAQPVTEAVHDRIAVAASKLLSNPQFQTILAGALTRLHSGFLNIVNGNAQYFDTTNGYLTFDLLGVIDAVITQLQADGVLPTAADFPRFDQFNDRTDFLNKLSAYTQAQLPPDFGQIPVAKASTIDTIGQALHMFDVAIVGTAVAALVFAVLGVVLADRRWRAIAWLGVTTLVLLGLIIGALFGAQAYADGVIANPDSHVLVGALAGSLAGSLTQWLIVVAVAVLFITIPAAFMARRSTKTADKKVEPTPKAATASAQ